MELPFHFRFVLLCYFRLCLVRRDFGYFHQMLMVPEISNENKTVKKWF